MGAVSGHLSTGTAITLGVISDLHLAPADTPLAHFNRDIHLGQSRQRTLDALRALPPVDATVVLGDLSNSAVAADYAFLLACLNALPQPSLLIAGNHDIPEPLTHAEPLAFAVRSQTGNKVRFLDGSSCSGDAISITAPALRRNHSGYHVELGGDAAHADQPDVRVWLSHFPVLSVQSHVEGRGLRYAGDLSNRADCEDHLLRTGLPTVVLHGHLHTRATVTDRTLLQLGTPSTVEDPCEATIVTIGRHPELTVRCQALALGVQGRLGTPNGTARQYEWRDYRWSLVT